MKKEGMAIYWTTMSTPIGELVIEATENGIRRLAVGSKARELKEFLESDGEARESRERLSPAVKQLEEYFEGRRSRFSLPLDLSGSGFQVRVWSEIMSIPCGETRSYKEIAERSGFPNSYRAVGMACAKNPIPIVVPCHRVIASDGSLGGYGYGLQLKEWLLRLEDCRRARSSSLSVSPRALN